MNKVSESTLGSLIEFQRGYDLPKSHFIKGNFPVQSSNGILGYHNEYKVEGPGVTIGRSGTVGLPHFIKSNFYPHNTALFIKDFKGNDVEYIFYLLKNLKLGDKKSGSGVPTMNRNHLHPLKIIAHLDIQTQKAIAKVLSDLDAKIELNNKINQELEAMAKTLYDYWFVQFDFPLDKNFSPLGEMSKGQRGYKSSGGKMVYSEELKREIPEGWKVGKVKDIANITTGKLDSNAEIENGKYHFYTCAVNPVKTDSYAFDDSVILIAGNNASGNFHVNRFKGKFNAYQRTYVFISKNEIYLEYLFQVLKRQMVILKNKGNGSQTKFLTISMLTDIPIFNIDSDLMESFFNITNPLYFKQMNILNENQQLTALRDWLLPMLMNGQVSVGKV